MVPLLKQPLQPKLLLLPSPTKETTTQNLLDKLKERQSEENQLGNPNHFMVVLPKLNLRVHTTTELITVLLPRLLLQPKLPLLPLPTKETTTQNLLDKSKERQSEENQHGNPNHFMVVLPKRKVNHGMSHFFQEPHWPTHASMPTKLPKLMPMLIKLAPLLVTLPGTPTPPPELDPKLLLSMPHTQTIPSTCSFLTFKVMHGESHFPQEHH